MFAPVCNVSRTFADGKTDYSSNNTLQPNNYGS